MQLKDLQSILELFSKYGLTSLDVSEGDFSVNIKKESTMATPAAISIPAAAVLSPKDVTTTEQTPTPIIPNGTPVKAPMVGVFYTSKSPEDAPYVSVGSTVIKGEVIGLMEAMKMMNEIKAPVSGTITSICASNEALVAFDEVLFTIEESAHVS